MSKHAFDKEIRNRIISASAPVPADMWDRISSQVQQPKPKALPWWMISLVSVAITAGAITLFLLVNPFESNDSALNVESTSIAQEGVAQNTSSNSEGVIQNTSSTLQEGVITAGNSNKNNNYRPSEMAKAAQIATPAQKLVPSKTNNTIDPTLSTMRSKSAASGNQSVALNAGNNKNAPDSDEATTATIAGISVEVSNQEIHGSPTNPATIGNNSGVADDAMEEMRISKSDAPFISGDAPTNFSDDTKAILRNPRALALLNNTSLMDEVTHAKQKSLTYNPCAVKGNIECYSFVPATKKWYFELMAGPTYHASILSAKNREAEDLLTLREDTESYLFSYTASARVSYLMGNGLAIRSGLSYTELGEKFEFFDPSADRTRLVQVIIDTIPIGPDLLRIVRDSVWVTEKGQRTIEYPNRYRFVDIPFMIGYEVENKDLILGINGGVLFNLALAQKGKFMNASGSPVLIDNKDSQQSIYKSNAGISLIASVNAGYKLSEDIQVFVEPQLRYFLKPLNVSGYNIEHDVFTASMQFGIRMGLQ
jgi:hypothetical protein